jgi:hypothetical protein
MKAPVFIFVLGFVLSQHVNAQTVQLVTQADEVQRLELVQRVLQYEIMLGSDLSSGVALCIDEKFSNAWMLPENPNAEVSAQATERVRRALELCQANSGEDPMPSRLASQIRRNMEEQFKIAQALNASKKAVQSCMSNAQAQDTYKACMTTALPASRNESSWPRWAMLFDRRTTLALSVPVGSMGNTLNLPVRP